MAKFANLLESPADSDETSQVCFQLSVGYQRRIHAVARELSVSNAAVLRALVEASLSDLESEVKAWRSRK